jgi:hypothetical protein
MCAFLILIRILEDIRSRKFQNRKALTIKKRHHAINGDPSNHHEASTHRRNQNSAHIFKFEVDNESVQMLYNWLRRSPFLKNPREKSRCNFPLNVPTHPPSSLLHTP